MTILSVGIVAIALSARGGIEPDRLTVEDNQILKDGQPWTFQGVAVGDPVTARADRPVEDYSFLQRDWKADAVRLSVHPFVWKHRDRSEVLDLIDRDVRGAREVGLVVLIDWHSIGWPDGGYQIPNWPGGERDTYDSSMAPAREFWGEMAKRYGRDGGVAFELWNEPASFDAGGKVIDDPGWEKLRPHLQELLDLIRKQSDNLVIGAGTHWTYDLRGIKEHPLEGKNVAYAWHVYAGHDENDPKRWAEHLDALDAVAPVVVTEWGFQRGVDAHFKGGPDDFGTPFAREFLDARTPNWTAWVWHPSWGPPMLEDDWRTPNEFGRFVRDRLRKEGPPK